MVNSKEERSEEEDTALAFPLDVGDREHGD